MKSSNLIISQLEGTKIIFALVGGEELVSVMVLSCILANTKVQRKSEDEDESTLFRGHWGINDRMTLNMWHSGIAMFHRNTLQGWELSMDKSHSVGINDQLLSVKKYISQLKSKVRSVKKIHNHCSFKVVRFQVNYLSFIFTR